MDKKPFVTKQQIEEITKHIPHHFIFMMRRGSEKMQKQ